MNELWVARDIPGTEVVYIYHEKPELMDKWYQTGGDMWEVSMDAFPDLKPGECRRLLMAEEQS